MRTESTGAPNPSAPNTGAPNPGAPKPGRRAGRFGRFVHGLSLRARLLVVVAVILATALLVAGIMTLSTMRTQLQHQLDEKLLAVVNDPASVGQLFNGVAPHGPYRRGDVLPSQFVVQFNGDDGQVVGPVADGDWVKDLPDLPRMTSQEAGDDAHLRTIHSHDTTWRALISPARLGDQAGTVVVALPMSDAESTLESVAVGFALASVSLVLLLLVVGWFAIGRAFRPLREVQGVARAFGSGDRSRRVAVTAPNSEVGQLGTSVNAMLDEIGMTLAAREASERRMRQFVGDASHELRTPLAAVRGFAELYRMGAVSAPDDVRNAFRRIEDESTRMAGLVEDLLMLARLDAQRPMRPAPVDLVVLAADAVHDARALAPDRVVRVTGLHGGGPEPVELLGDEARLRQVVTNLIANAIRHTPAGSPIEIAVGPADGYAVVEVVDHGPGIPAELAERIFERFYRMDVSRSRESGGSGLGLAIVAAIIHSHGGRAQVRPTRGGGATFVVAVPMTSQETASPGGPRTQPTPVS